MKEIGASERIYVTESAIPQASRGVFAKRPIGLGEIIEVCPVIEVPLSDAANDDDNGLLTDYFFYFGDGLAVVLGFGSLYNHSYEPNATYIKKPEDRTIEFVALRDITKDEEITVSYNDGKPDDKTQPQNKGVPPAT